jgi:hypothetical protein
MSIDHREAPHPPLSHIGALLAELVRDGPATTVSERELDRKKPIEVTRVKISAAGRRMVKAQQ